VAGVIFYHKEHEELQDEYGTQELRNSGKECSFAPLLMVMGIALKLRINPDFIPTSTILQSFSLSLLYPTGS